MKTLEIAQFGIEELTNQEMIDIQGGTSSGHSNSNGSLIYVGSINVSDVLNVSTGDILSGNAIGSGNNFEYSSKKSESHSSCGC